MSRHSRLAAAVLFFFACASAAVAAERVSAKVENVTIPTFTLGPDEPAPAIFETNDTNAAYPRTNIDIASRAAEPVDKEYQMAVLENSLIRVEVLPEVGGHVWRIVDKKTGRDLVWTNDAVKPVRVGRRHGWIAGGIEFPFPVGNHGEDAMDPYRWTTRDNEDGSATVSVSSFDHFYRFWSTYDITVRPDDARMAITVRLYNPTPVRNRYQIWVNAAVRVSDQMQYVFPVDYVTGHGFSGIFSWPSMDRGYDNSYWKNDRQSMGVFGWNADYMGAYYHDDDYGIIRYSPQDFTEGIKLWTWGTDSRWTVEYSMNQGPYGEIQGGRWPTQTMYGWLEPHQMDTWTEYWYPVKGLGGVDEASKYAAMKVNVAADGAPKAAEILINAETPITGKLVVTSGGRTLVSKNVTIPAGEVLKESADISSLAADATFNVSVIDGSDLTVISHDVELKKVPGPRPEEPADVRVAGTGPEWDALAVPLAAEMNDANLSTARSGYDGVTKDYPAFEPGYVALGILQYKQTDYEAAAATLAKALELKADDPEPKYYLGLAQLALGRPGAVDTLKSVTGDIRFTHAAKVAVGREEMKAGRYRDAVATLNNACDGWSRDAVNFDMIAVALRYAGTAKDSSGPAVAAKDDDDEEEAEAPKPDFKTGRQAIAAAFQADPLDPFAMVEDLFAGGKATPEAIRAALGKDSDLYVETALFYHDLGAKDDAVKVIEAGSDLAESAYYVYYQAYFANEAGDAAGAAELAKKADSMGTDYVFPHRPEDITVMKTVANLTGNGGYPTYYEATLLYWLGRYDTATDMWSSLVGKYKVPGLYRNVARAYTEGRLSQVYDGAIDLYQKAVEEDPKDPQLYYALDDLYQMRHDDRDRTRLLQQGMRELPGDDMMALRQVVQFVDRRRYDQAKNILETRKWQRAHQSYELMRLGVRAITETYTGLAMQAASRGNNDAGHGVPQAGRRRRRDAPQLVRLIPARAGRKRQGAGPMVRPSSFPPTAPSDIFRARSGCGASFRDRRQPRLDGGPLAEAARTDSSTRRQKAFRRGRHAGLGDRTRRSRRDCQPPVARVGREGSLRLKSPPMAARTIPRLPTKLQLHGSRWSIAAARVIVAGSPSTVSRMTVRTVAPSSARCSP